MAEQAENIITREPYLNEIRPFYESDLIKIITGIRRSGKSVILHQVIEELEAQGKKCIFLDFDLRSVRKQIPDADALIARISQSLGKEKIYVFLDEIQNVNGWNEACRTLRLYNCSLFITGSNSKLLSKEFTKELSGRYVSFRVRPFSYREAQEYMRKNGKDYSVMDYLIWGGFPASLALTDENAKRRYLTDLNETIVYNDLENRYRIRKKDEFERIVDYVLISNGRIFSAKSISDYMKSHRTSVSVPTVIRYLGYLEEAYVINRVSMYSLKAKEKLDYYYKLYDEDVSFNSIRQTGGRFDLSHNLENAVLNELYYRGYEVFIGQNRGQEIDFRAEKDGKVYLIQVAYSVVEEKAYEREFGAFAGIDNASQKILITNDEIDYSTSTVRHIRLKDFLAGEEL